MFFAYCVQGLRNQKVTYLKHNTQKKNFGASKWVKRSFVPSVQPASNDYKEKL